MTAAILDLSTATTSELIATLHTLNRPKRFLLETFFPSTVLFDTAQVVFDKVPTTRRLAPFVSPLVKGKPQPISGETLTTYRPPYLKPKHTLSPDIGLLAPMPVGGIKPANITFQVPPTMRQRLDDLRARALQDEDDQITRREEWMAAQLLLTGSFNVVAEDHPPMNVDLGRPAANTVVLTGALRWGNLGVSPFQNLQDQAAAIASATGFVPNTVVFEPKAARLFLGDPFLMKIGGQFQGPPRTLDIAGEVQPGSNGEAVLLGSFGGFTFWQYQHTYSDTDGTTRKLLPDNTVIMGSVTGAEGVMTYGAILDMGVLHAIRRYPKEWLEQDPAVRHMMTQAAPLPLLGRPETTFAMTVG